MLSFAGSRRGMETYIKERKAFFTNKSVYSSIYTFIIVSIILISIRYISKGAKWVDKTSKKEL